MSDEQSLLNTIRNFCVTVQVRTHDEFVTWQFWTPYYVFLPIAVHCTDVDKVVRNGYV